MENYRDAGGNSGIKSYEISNEGITLVFKNGGTYLYTEENTGAQHIAEMKRLALAGQGLNTYLNTHVHRYSEKFDAASVISPPTMAKVIKGPFRTR